LLLQTVMAFIPASAAARVWKADLQDVVGFLSTMVHFFDAAASCADDR
jgi:hypothetical protein